MSRAQRKELAARLRAIASELASGPARAAASATSTHPDSRQAHAAGWLEQLCRGQARNVERLADELEAPAEPDRALAAAALAMPRVAR